MSRDSHGDGDSGRNRREIRRIEAERPRAAILVTGDEVLRGRIQDGNGGVLASSLEALGAHVASIRIVGDELDEIVAALSRHIAEGSRLVCVTGGLGPTHDDLTMEAVARVTGRPLSVDPTALAMVRARSRGLPVDAPAAQAAHIKQASLPTGATVLPPAGTAPGCLVEHDGALVVVLPGPPWELRAMWTDAVRDQPQLRHVLDRASAPHERVLRIRARPESQLVQILAAPDAPDRSRLTLGICARDGELEMTVRGDAEAAGALQEHLAGVLGEALFSTDGRTVDDIVVQGLFAAGHTVSVAESCTGGGLGARFSARAGASAHFVGGVIAYANRVKTAVLGVPEHTIAAHGAVSAECARAMADGVRRLTGSTWALSITGVAGPDGGTAEKPVGLVHIGRAGPGGTISQEYHLRGDRDQVRRVAAAAAMHLLRQGLAEE